MRNLYIYVLRTATCMSKKLWLDVNHANVQCKCLEQASQKSKTQVIFTTISEGDFSIKVT